MTSKQKPKLGYWDIRAIGEPIRFLLNYLEIDFEDYRIPLGEGENIMVPWTSQKYSHGLDLPNLPFYIDEDVKLTQSQAILEYIGGKHNLCGDTLQEKATAGMVAQALNDLRWQSWLAYNATDFHEIKEDWKQTIPGRFSEINKFMEGKKYILGSKICYADFVLYECVEWFRAFAPDIFEESEELANVNNLRKRIEALPTIKAYMESDRFKSFPFFGPFVHVGHSKDPDFKPIPVSYRNWMAKYPLDK